MKKVFDNIKLMNFWPPLFGAGIHIRDVAEDFSQLTVEMKQRWWNTNAVGVHYGGSIYSMTDPFYMLMLMRGLGKDYIVWDKAADVHFKKPGKGTLTAHFNLTAELLADIKRQADENYKVEPVFKVDVLNEAGEVVAEVNKTLYVRRKDKVPRAKL